MSGLFDSIFGKSKPKDAEDFMVALLEISRKPRDYTTVATYQITFQPKKLSLGDIELICHQMLGKHIETSIEMDDTNQMVKIDISYVIPNSKVQFTSQ